MAKAKIHIYITPKEGILDPQGETIAKALKNLNYLEVKKVRMGKFIVLEIDGDAGESLEERVKAMCEKLLANPVIEDYRFELKSF